MARSKKRHKGRPRHFIRAVLCGGEALRLLDYRELSRSLRNGNLDAKRDWGHARDFVEGQE